MKTDVRHRLIVMPFGLPLNWSADYEYQTAVRMARTNTVIIFLIGEGLTLRRLVTSPKKLFIPLTANLFIFSPLLLLPFHRFAAIRSLNSLIAIWQLHLITMFNRFRHLKKILWIFSLQHGVFPGQFGKKYLKVYDCVDAFTSADPKTKAFFSAAESKHVSQSQIIFVNSKTLYENKKGSHRLVYQLPEGLFAHHIYKNASKLREPHDMRLIPHPRVIFAGNINARLKFSLIKKLVSLTPNVSYIFLGKNDPLFDAPKHINVEKELHELQTYKNTYFLGARQKTQVPAYIRHADIGFIPYDDHQEFNRMSFPMKTMEFFYFGLPVLATPIPELLRLSPMVTIMKTPPQTKRLIAGMYTKNTRQKIHKKRRSVAVSNSIDRKLSIAFSILKKNFPSLV